MGHRNGYRERHQLLGLRWQRAFSLAFLVQMAKAAQRSRLLHHQLGHESLQMVKLLRIVVHDGLLLFRLTVPHDPCLPRASSREKRPRFGSRHLKSLTADGAVTRPSGDSRVIPPPH
jgi:hypothetical protein